MGKAAGGSSGRRACTVRGAWLACMAAAVAAPAFGQQTAAQLDDLTHTMTQYSQPKAHAQAPAAAATTAKASASEPGKHSRRSVAQPLREKPARSGQEPAAAVAKPALAIAIARPGRAQAGGGRASARNTSAIDAEGRHDHSFATTVNAAGLACQDASRGSCRTGRGVHRRADVESQRYGRRGRWEGEWRCALLEAAMELGGRCRGARLADSGSGGVAPPPPPQARRQGARQHRSHGAAG